MKTKPKLVNKLGNQLMARFSFAERGVVVCLIVVGLG
jgi:hypothetical protein